MSDATEFNKLKKKVDAAQEGLAKAQGALDNIMKRLKDEFKCDTVEEAKKLLKKLQTDERKARDEFEDAADEFDKKWGLYVESQDAS